MGWTLISGQHELSTLIRTFPRGLENSHACNWILDNFPEITHMSVFLENCQISICLHGCSPIHKDFFRSCSPPSVALYVSHFIWRYFSYIPCHVSLSLSWTFWLGHFLKSKISFKSRFLIKCYIIVVLNLVWSVSVSIKKNPKMDFPLYLKCDLAGGGGIIHYQKKFWEAKHPQICPSFGGRAGKT